jgi:hypothetical protein
MRIPAAPLGLPPEFFGGKLHVSDSSDVPQRPDRKDL